MKHKDMEQLAHHYICAKGGAKANPRVSAVLERLVADLFKAIDDLDLTEDEIWAGIDFLEGAGKNGELKLMVAGLGLDRFMDIRLEESEARYGIGGGTPRTIEGPLYVHGAPVCEGFARLDDDPAEGAEVLIMEGTVRTINGEPLPGAVVEVWHANGNGDYSYFDESQSEYNLRRTIIADDNGHYCFRSVCPAGYGVPADGSCQKMLDKLDRHGQRPPHIHFFVHAADHRKLTTQINLEGSKYTYDDYAFADKLALTPRLRQISDEEMIKNFELDGPFKYIEFDFRLHPEVPGAPPSEVERRRARDYLAD